ncbi:MAG: hypothetical protein OXD48_00120, partial [Litoreibacter sp.]|nr:hypothetical protein [Litoreibacter sp.]
ETEYVQRAINGGRCFRNPRRSGRSNFIEGYVSIDGNMFQVVLRRTEDRSELYLVTMFRVPKRYRDAISVKLRPV